MKTTIHNFINEAIQTHKEGQQALLQRLNMSGDAYIECHNRYMAEPTQENERQALKASESKSQDYQSALLHMNRELEERLRVASEIIEGLCKELGKDVSEVIYEYVKYDF